MKYQSNIWKAGIDWNLSEYTDEYYVNNFILNNFKEPEPEPEPEPESQPEPQPEPESQPEPELNQNHQPEPEPTT